MGDKRSLPSHIASSRNLGLCHYLMEGRYSYSGNRCPRSKTLMRAERFSLFRYDQWWWNHFGPNVFAISGLNCDGKFSSLKNVEMGGRYAIASESGQEPLRNPERRDALKELSSNREKIMCVFWNVSELHWNNCAFRNMTVRLTGPKMGVSPSWSPGNLKGYLGRREFHNCSALCRGRRQAGMTPRFSTLDFLGWVE